MRKINKIISIAAISMIFVQGIVYSAPDCNLRPLLRFSISSQDENVSDIKVLIFDMDLTLYESGGLSAANEETCYNFAQERFDRTKEEVKAKKKELNSMTGMLKYYATENGLDENALINEYYDYLGKNIDPSLYLKPDPDLRMMLEKLSKQYRLAVVTNNGTVFTEKTLRALGVDDLFELVMTQQIAGKGKPNTEMFELVCRHFNIEPVEAVSIGDRQDIDLDVAAKIGMPGILVTGPHDMIENLPDRIGRIEMIDYLDTDGSVSMLPIIESHLRVLAREAGQIAIKIKAGGEISASWKIHGNKTKELVTEPDRQIQKLFDAELVNLIPESVVIGEESFTKATVEKAKKTRYVWIVDPIDGSKVYNDGKDGYCIVVTLLDNGYPIYAFIFAPEYDIDGKGYSLFEACRDREGAYLNGNRIHVNDKISFLGDAKVSMYESSTVPSPPYYAAVKNKVREVEYNKGGSGLINVGKLACSLEYPGHEVLYLKPTPSVWDIIHGAFILQKAGGKATYDNGVNILPLDMNLFNFEQTGSPRLPSVILGAELVHRECLTINEDYKTKIAKLKAIVDKMQPFKAVAFDFDGTITIDREHIDEPEVARDILKLLALGKDIFILTGQWEDEMQEHFIDELKKYKEFKEEYLARIHLYTYGGAWGFNAKEGPGKPYYKIPFRNAERVKSAFEDFFKQKGWLNNPAYLVVIRDCQIIVRRTEKPDPKTALEDRNIIEEWLKSQNFKVSVTSGSMTCMVGPEGVSKLIAVNDIKNRFGLDDDTLIKIGDMGGKLGNDYELLKWPNSFTVDKFDPENPQQVRVSEILEIKGPKATAILLGLLIDKIESAAKIDKVLQSTAKSQNQI